MDLLVTIFCVATAILAACVYLHKTCHSRRRSRTLLPPDQLLFVLEFLPRTDVDVCQIASRLLSEILRRNWKNFKHVKRVFAEIRLESSWLDGVASYRAHYGLARLAEFGACRAYSDAPKKINREHVLVALFKVKERQVVAWYYRGCAWNQWRKFLCSVNGTVVKTLSAVEYKRCTGSYCCAILRGYSPTVDFILHRYRQAKAYLVDFQAFDLEFNNRGEYDTWRRLVKNLGCTKDAGSESDGRSRRVFHLRMRKP